MILRSGRLPDWPARLNAAVASWRDRQFGWSDNCALFAGDCVLAQTGIDPLGGIRAAMHSARGWAAILRANGGSLGQVVSNRLGDSQPAQRACRGDIVGMVSGTGMARGLALGVCFGERAIFLDDVGCLAVPMRQIERVWAVG